MEAARLKPVEDRIDRGINGLPSAGTCEQGKSGSLCGIPKGTVGAGPAPVPAINSGKELPVSLLGPSQNVSNGAGKLYGGQPDNDADDVPLSVMGEHTSSLEDSFEKHLDVGQKDAQHPSNE